jgi:predicted GH43/DUF377 family glycosyl hydrolase
VLFDRKDPTKVLARADNPIFAPEQKWEKLGQVPNVVFVEGLVREGTRWLFYYGGADKYIGVAEAKSRTAVAPTPAGTAGSTAPEEAQVAAAAQARSHRAQ